MALLSRRRGMQPERRREEVGPMSLRTELDRLFDDFLSGWPARSALASTEEFIPPVDISETDGQVKVSVELPGMSEQDVNVELDGDLLTISGEKREEEEKEEEGGRYWRESSYGKFVRQVPLPAEVKTENAEASFKNGRLIVTMPKAEEAKEKRRKVEIKSAE